MQNKQNSDISIVNTFLLVIGIIAVTAIIFRPQSSIVIDLGDGNPSVKISDVEKVEKVPLKR